MGKQWQGKEEEGIEEDGVVCVSVCVCIGMRFKAISLMLFEQRRLASSEQMAIINARCLSERATLPIPWANFATNTHMTIIIIVLIMLLCMFCFVLLRFTSL